MVAAVMVTAGAVIAPSVVRADPPSDALAYAVFAFQRASIGSKAQVQGDAGCLFDELSLGQGTRVAGAAAAPTIRLRHGARASGGYFCSSIDGGGATCSTLPNPLVGAPAIVLVGPVSNADVKADKHTKPTSPLAAGAYGTLEAGTAAEMNLAGGTYQFESIDVGSRGKLLCLAACDVTVRSRVRLGQAARLGAVDSIPASSATIRVAAQGESTALDAKSRSQIRGTIYAPSADVRLGAAAKVSGALVGNTVSVSPRARLQGPPSGS